MSKVLYKKLGHVFLALNFYYVVIVKVTNA